MQLDLDQMVYGQFGSLDPITQEDRANSGFLTDYVERLFASNGRVIRPDEIRVKEWLDAPDRASYASMAGALWRDMQPRIDPDDVGLVLMANWMPDLHLGTSVTNYLMHVGQMTSSIGFSLSECGTAAPFVALEWMDRYLRVHPGKSGLLLICDQRNLMYRVPEIEARAPVNAACLLEVSGRSGLGFAGIKRADPGVDRAGFASEAARALGLEPRHTCLVAATPVAGFAETIAPDPRQMCAAPFIALAERGPVRRDVLILDESQDQTLACALTRGAGRSDHVH